MRDDLLDLLEGGKPTLLERTTIGDRILHKIVTFVDTFINGIAGA
jgi:type I restriction enzyme R subunit